MKKVNARATKSHIVDGVDDLDGSHGVRILERFGDTKFYNVFFHGDIEDVWFYSGLVHLLEKARPNDHFTFRFNSPGGHVSSVQSLVPAMRGSAAHITGIAEGDVMSAATSLFFACDSYKITPYSVFMFHDGSSRVGGKMGEILKYAESSIKLYEKLDRDLLTPYLSTSEIEEFQAGSDLYILADEMIKRIKKHTPKKLIS